MPRQATRFTGNGPSLALGGVPADYSRQCARVALCPPRIDVCIDFAVGPGVTVFDILSAPSGAVRRPA